MASPNLFDIPSKPYQPTSLKFPKRSFGQEKVVQRSFQGCWFHQWPFLYYDEGKDSVYCHICLMGFKLNRMKSSRAHPAFVSIIY